MLHGLRLVVRKENGAVKYRMEGTCHWLSEEVAGWLYRELPVTYILEKDLIEEHSYGEAQYA